MPDRPLPSDKGLFLRLGLFIVAPIVLVTVLAAGISAFLNYGKFARTLAEVESARFALVAKGVKVAIEANLNLGLPLPDLATAPQVLERERMIAADTTAVLVFAADGTILFASGDASAIDRAPDAWRRDAEWSANAGTSRVVGMPLVNAFGTTVGGVAVVYPDDARDRALAEMARHLTTASLWAAAATAALSLSALTILLQRLRVAIDKLARSLRPGGDDRGGEGARVIAAAAQARQIIEQASARLPRQAGQP